MKKTYLILIASLMLSCLSVKGQKDYTWHIKRADSLYQEKEYKAAARSYYSGFLTLEGKAYHNDRYNAACSYSLAKMNDSAFYHLNYMTEKSADYLYNAYSHVLKDDKDLNNIRKDKRWEAFAIRLDSIKTEKEKHLNLDLVKQLEPIYKSDQGIRTEYQGMSEKYEREDPEMKAFFKRWREIDSINEIKVTAILDEYGWLGSDVIGGQGNSTLFLVIQHAPLETQEKYLPMMREAVKDGRAYGSQLALLEDRVNLRNNRHQIYGSQIGSIPDSDEMVVLPLKDPMNVDKRRSDVGLGPLAEYTNRFGFEWNAEAYEKRLPELEEIFLKKEEK